MAGSQRRSREFWAQQVRRWRASGESCAAFARRAGVNPKTLSWWAWKLGSEVEEAEEPEEPEPLPFVELMPVTVDGRIELEIDGVVVRLPNDFEADALARVVDVLRGPR